MVRIPYRCVRAVESKPSTQRANTLLGHRTPLKALKILWRAVIEARLYPRSAGVGRSGSEMAYGRQTDVEPPDVDSTCGPWGKRKWPMHGHALPLETAHHHAVRTGPAGADL